MIFVLGSLAVFAGTFSCCEFNRRVECNWYVSRDVCSCSFSWDMWMRYVESDINFTKVFYNVNAREAHIAHDWKPRRTVKQTASTKTENSSRDSFLFSVKSPVRWWFVPKWPTTLNQLTDRDSLFPRTELMYRIRHPAVRQRGSAYSCFSISVCVQHRERRFPRQVASNNGSTAINATGADALWLSNTTCS